MIIVIEEMEITHISDLRQNFITPHTSNNSLRYVIIISMADTRRKRVL